MRSPLKIVCLGFLVPIVYAAAVQAGPLDSPLEKPVDQAILLAPPPQPAPPPSSLPSPVPPPSSLPPPESSPSSGDDPPAHEACQLLAPPQQGVEPVDMPIFPVVDGIIPKWKLLAGAGFDIVGPFQENNRAYTLFLSNGKGLGGTTQSNGFDDPFTVASRFWLGVAGPGGWGFRVRNWNFSEAENQTAALDGASPAGSFLSSARPLGLGVSSGTALLAPGNADVLNAVQHLNVHVLDFELTREIEAGNFFLVLSAGARVARLSRRYDVDISNTANNFSDDAEVDRLRSGQRFVAGGPTLALQGWYPIGWGGLSIYGTGRGSFLFGDFHQFANVTTVQANDGTITETIGPSATACHKAAVPVGELELGIQWSGEWGRFHPFLRTGVEAQTWFDALSGATVREFHGGSASLDSNLSFFGVTFQAGLNY